MTQYKEIDVGLIDQNPFQTRKAYDKQTLEGIMATASDRIGIRNAPMVRPSTLKTGRYQLAHGWGRLLAWKGLGRAKLWCRIEDLGDADMKKEVLVENVNRANLNEDELYQALDQYRKDLGLEAGDYGFASTMERATGLSRFRVSEIYDIKEIRPKLEMHLKQGEEPSGYMITETQSLKEEDRIKLIVKATERGWAGRTLHTLTPKLRDMTLEVREMILEDKGVLTPKVIESISDIKDAETQRTVLSYIQTYGLAENLAIKHIQRALEEKPVTETVVIDEAKDVLEDFHDVERKIMAWGVNHYKILGESGWAKARPIFERIEQRMRWLMALKVEG